MAAPQLPAAPDRGRWPRADSATRSSHATDLQAGWRRARGPADPTSTIGPFILDPMDSPAEWFSIALALAAAIIASSAEFRSRRTAAVVEQLGRSRQEGRRKVAAAIDAGNQLLERYGRALPGADADEQTEFERWDRLAWQAVVDADPALEPIYSRRNEGHSTEQVVRERLDRLEDILDRL